MDREHYTEYYRLKYNNALADRILNEIKYIMSKDGTFTTYLINEAPFYDFIDSPENIRNTLT